MMMFLFQGKLWPKMMNLLCDYYLFCLIFCHSVFFSRLLSHIYTLLALDVFGMLKESALYQLRAAMPSIEINKFPFSSIARPTTGIRRTSIWGLRVRDSLY